MPRLELDRDELCVSVQRLDASHLELEYRAGDKHCKQTVVQAQLADGKRLVPPAHTIEEWTLKPPGPRLLKRISLEIHATDLVAIPWESLFADTGIVVRVTPVPAMAGVEPLKLPLRIVQIGGPGSLSLRHLVTGLVGNRTRAELRRAVDVKVVTTLPLFYRRDDGPTTDILHFNRGVLNAQSLTLSADAEIPGTQAWLARYCFVRQTRLVVIACDQSNAATFMRLAQSLTECGGPATVVESLADGERKRFWRGLYSDLIHDFPLDASLGRAFGEWRNAGLEPLETSNRGRICLFGGAGREDELRVSSIGLRALSVRDSSPAIKGTRVLAHLQSLRRSWPELHFSDHERQGLIPMSRDLGLLRRSVQDISLRPELPVALVRLPRPAARNASAKRRGRRVSGFIGAPSKLRGLSRAAPQRFLNAAFYSGEAGDTPKLIPQRGARLAQGKIVHLGVDIGPRNPKIRAADVAPLKEELFRWTPQMKGVWVELGVTGVDFDLIGSSVREIWLPREGASERVYFPVVPRHGRNVSRLRVCLYFRSEIVESIRMAAITKPKVGKDYATKTTQRILAESLGLTPEKIREAGYIGRLEYSTSSPAQVAARQHEKAQPRFSIVVNDWDSDKVITVKCPGMQSAKILSNRDIAVPVAEIRALLREISVVKLRDNSEAYSFVQPGKENTGTAAQLGEALSRLAAAGWPLFDQLMLQDERGALLSALEVNDEAFIHVAHILREDVIPWNLIYDRPYSSCPQTDEQGNKVANDFCDAAMPDEDGKLPIRKCFGKGCKLEGYPDKRITNEHGETLLPESVVCPLHFWGFRYSVEIPPQQVSPGEGGIPMCKEIPISGKAKVAVGVNCSLALYSSHLKALSATATQVPAVWHDPAEYNRTRILAMLQDSDIAGVYFYCHTSSSPEGLSPTLVFKGPLADDAEQIITPAVISGGKWTLRPLVFLNGCNTTGYSPRSLSLFFKKFVDDRGASGLIATEIIVWEQFATAMAARFFEYFFDMVPAGQALLRARRWLLAKYNPMGLSYTLYASSDLQVRRINH